MQNLTRKIMLASLSLVFLAPAAAALPMALDVGATGSATADASGALAAAQAARAQAEGAVEGAKAELTGVALSAKADAEATLEQTALNVESELDAKQNLAERTIDRIVAAFEQVGAFAAGIFASAEADVSAGSG